MPPRSRRSVTKEIVERPEGAPVPTVTLRKLLSDVTEEAATVESIRGIVMDALGASTRALITCPNCGEEFRRQMPDVKRQLDACISLLEQIEGKATQQAPAATTITIMRPPL